MKGPRFSEIARHSPITAEVSAEARAGHSASRTTPDETYFYSNDTFTFNGSPIDMNDFEGVLTGTTVDASDVLDVDAYTGDPADTSAFDVTDDNLPSPWIVEAKVSDLDGDGTTDDVTLTWSRVGQGDAIYNVYVDDVANDTFVALMRPSSRLPRNRRSRSSTVPAASTTSVVRADSPARSPPVTPPRVADGG